VASFREKPDERLARRFVERGNFFWNAGMFFWRVGTILDLVRKYQPKTATLLAGLPPVASKKFGWALREAYPLCEDISIDYAILEKTDKVVGIAVDDMGWNDVGSWQAVYNLVEKDTNKNAARNAIIAEASRGNYVDANKLVALLGVENLIVVDTPDALLIADRSKAQDVSKIVKALESEKREDLL
jgi:mannose-1-phosphate guanylyltransferase